MGKKMIVKNLLAIKGVEVKDGQLRIRVNELYLHTKVLAYVVFKTSTGAHSFAFIFKGQKVWYAVIDGYRMNIGTTMEYIKSAKTKGDVQWTKALKAQILLEGM